MTTRTLESPFRETAWDQRLDKMLDDLKTTVTSDGERSSSRRDNSLVSSFRSTSRSESRNSNRSGIEDAGHVKHHHKEYTSPDKTTRVVTDQFEYDSGESHKPYQKKVIKSTYSNYKVTGDLSSDLDSLRQGPDPSVMTTARSTSDYQTDNTKVVSASQKVANKLVDALSTIGADGKPLPEGGSASSTMTSDYSTLTRLNKNIKELDSMLDAMDGEKERQNQQQTIVAAVRTEKRTVVRNTESDKSVTSDKEPLAKPIKPTEDVKKLTKSEEPASSKAESDGPTHAHSTNSYASSKTTKYTTSGITNGKPSYDDDDDAEMITDPTGGDVRKIVWRNRFEKTYETQEGTPSISIEEEARRRNQKHYDKITTSKLSTIQPQPPQISPGGQSWTDPIPMPTPPQVSPKGEPGVAYVYTYGQTNSQVQHLPPLNYVTMPSGASVPPSDGAPSPTPSGNQPIIYHYSYHYTLQPGQTIPEGVPQPPGSHPHQPALQMAPPSSSSSSTPHPPTDTVPLKTGPQQSSSVTTSYDYKKRSEHTAEHTDTTNVQHHHHYHPQGEITGPDEPGHPRGPYDGPIEGGYPKGREPGISPPDEPNRNISITINKTSSHVTHSKDYPSGGPSTSTPFPTPGRRSRSPSPDRYTRGTGPSPHGTVTYTTHSSHYSDSLDRVRRHPNEGLPFPDTSPIKPADGGKIPKRVDDLMTSLSDSEDGPHRGPIDGRGMNGPKSPPEKEPLISTKVSLNSAELSLSEKKKAEMKREETKNIAGPPVYYPPGHHQLFDESMHTMTLKENKRRGMAKWRMEKASGYKESSSSSDSKAGMAMVPVCLPLCCGAACAIM